MKYLVQISITVFCFLLYTMNCNAAVVYVDIDAAPGGDGSSWAMAYDNITDAADGANAGDEIWIAEGTYEENFTVYKNLDIYGGFDGSEILFDQRDVVNNKTEIFYNGANEAIYLYNYNIKIDGIYFDGSMETAIDVTYVASAANYIISNCFFTGNYEKEVLFLTGYNGVNSIEIFNCVFYDTFIEKTQIGNTDEGYIINVGSLNTTIVNNTFIRNENTCYTIHHIYNSELVSESLNISNNIFQDETNYHLSFQYTNTLPIEFIFKNNVLRNDTIVDGYACDDYGTLLNLMELSENNLVYTYDEDDFLDFNNNDFRLPICSAFINKGSNDETVSDEDLTGNYRIGGDIVDAGAFENQLTKARIYVDKNATGSNTGNNWLNAYTNLQTAANAATCHTEIWVSEGIYRIENDGVELKDNTKLYGGFNGTQGELSQRDWNLYETILSGNINSTPSTSDDIPSLIELDVTAKNRIDIDGFTMKKTYYFNNSRPVIQSGALQPDIHLNNIIFRSNRNELMQHAGNIYLCNVLVDDNRSSFLFLNYLGGSFEAINCTFVDNESIILSANFANDVNINNCIFWDNIDGEIYANSADQVIFLNNTFDTLFIDAPTIDSSTVYHYDPLFVDAANNDFSLADCSPLIDLGIADFDLPTYDLARNERESNGQIDIGAYEFQYPTVNAIYVDLTATGSNNGSSWSNAFTDLQDAISAAIQGSQIWVAQGTYYPYDLASPDPMDRFLLDCGVSMYGGFLGNETSLEERDVENYITTLSGRDVNSFNLFSYHVLRLKDFTADAVVDGFTIEGGFASNANVTHGAGIWMSNSLGTVNNCKIKNNIAERGGAIAIIDSPKGNIRNCEITNNEAEIEGGAVYVKNSSFISRNNIYSVNLSLGGEAGGISLESSTATIKNNRMNNNVAITGGAFKLVDSELNIDYCTFLNNAAILSNKGGVLDLDNNSSVEISNTIIYGNIANNVTNNFSGSTGSIEINNSIIEGGWSGAGSNTIDEDPLLVDYIPQSCSPAMDIGTLEDLPNNDITLKSRIHGNGPDLGAYEQRNPYYVIGQAGPDKIVCNSTTFEIPYELEKYDTLYTEWDGSDQVSGVMFDVIFEVPVVLEAVSAHFECSGLATNKVYYKQGSYQGSEITEADWTEVHSSIITINDNCALGDTFTMSTDSILFNPGKRYGIYVSSARLISPTSYVYSSNEPTAGFGDTLYTDELYTIFHGRGTRDFRFDTPTASSQIFEGGLHISRYDSIQWHKDGIYLATGDTLEVTGGLPPGIFDYEAQVFIADGCSYFDTLQVTAYETITNDQCANAIAIDPTPIDSLGGVSILTSNNLCASPSGVSGSCNVSAGRDVWYKFFGTESSRLNIVIDNIFPITTKFNPSITVLEGTCGSFTEIACVDDYGNEESETVELTDLDPNAIYYIIIDGKTMQMGIYDLTFIDPCLTAYEEYDPLPDHMGSCLNQDLLLSSDKVQYDTLATIQNFLHPDKFGIYFNIVSTKSINVHRISSKLAAQTGIHGYQLYTRQGDALTAIDDMSLWDFKGAFTLTDPVEDIYEVPLDIDEVITSADTLGVFLYCTTTASPGIRVSAGSKILNNIAYTDQTLSVLYGNSSDGPAFTNNLGVLEAWPIGNIIYEEIETVSWYKNGNFVNNDYDLTVLPIDLDEYILQVIDYDQCRFRDTTIIRTEGKVVRNTNDDGWQSLRSVVGCAEWGLDTITFDPMLLGQKIKLNTAISFEAPNFTDNSLFIKGFSPGDKVKIEGRKSFLNNLIFVSSFNDTKLGIANMDFRNSLRHIVNNGDLLLQDVSITDNNYWNHLITNYGNLKLKNNIQLKKPVFGLISNHGHIHNELSGSIVIEGNVIIIDN